VYSAPFFRAGAKERKKNGVLAGGREGEGGSTFYGKRGEEQVKFVAFSYREEEKGKREVGEWQKKRKKERKKAMYKHLYGEKLERGGRRRKEGRGGL